MADSCNRWTWAGASVLGTSHEGNDLPKQDYAATAEYESAQGPVLAIVVCDGAGSAACSHIGARTACLSLHSLIRSYLSQNGLVRNLNEQKSEVWLNEVRRQILTLTQTTDLALREFATTVSVALLADDSLFVLMVGDSPCVFYDGTNWFSPIWPMRGEYANQTYFVTQDPLPFWRCVTLKTSLAKAAVFTDGIEKLVLREGKKEIFDPFFNGLFEDFPKVGLKGRDREFSDGLKSFLSSARVNNLTDDDKTLVIAARPPIK